MKKYLILFLIFAFVCSTSLAYASAYVPANGHLSVFVGDFNDDGAAEISGKFTAKEEGKPVTIAIFAPGITESNLTERIDQSDKWVYNGTAYADSNGEFKITITIEGTSGEYSAYLGPAENGETLARIPVYYSNKSENESALEILNSKAAAVIDNNDTVGIADVENFVDSNADELAFRFSLYEGVNQVNHTEVIKTLITYLKNEPFVVTNRSKATGVFRTLVFMRALTEDKITDLDTYAVYLPLFTGEDGILAEWYEDASTEEKAEIITRLKNLTYTTINEFENKAVEAAVLTRIHHAKGDGEVENILQAFENYTNILVSTLTRVVYNGLERQNYTDYTALKKAIEELKKTPLPESNPPLGGGGNVPPAIIQDNYYTNDEQQEILEESNGFNDVSEEDWYYDAVYELYDRGIISGKSKDTFAPDDSITREEIVKMLAVMENLTLTDGNAVFADVKAGDWFYPYVNAAAKYGIVNGVGEGVFGTGQNVTRQDIAVMLYNIASKKGITAETDENKFSDAESISDYAVDAVKMLNALKVINGYEDLSFKPLNFVTRAEAAKLIREFIYINR